MNRTVNVKFDLRVYVCEFVGIRRTIAAYFADFLADLLTAGLFLWLSWSPLLAAKRWDLPLEYAIRVLSLALTISTILILAGFVVVRLVRGVRGAFALFTSPYEEPEIALHVPGTRDPREYGVIRAVTPTWLAIVVGTIFLVPLACYALLVALFFYLVADPIPVLYGIYGSIPVVEVYQLLTPIPASSRYTLTPYIRHFYEPIAAAVIFLFHSPLVVAGLLSVWNYMHALRTGMRQVYRGL